MRFVSRIIVMIVAVGLWVPLGSTAAEAASAPLLYKPATASTAVVLSGRAAPRAVVRVQVLGSRWTTVRTVRAARTGAYRVTVPYPTRVRYFRARSSTQVSYTRAVSPRPAPKVKPPTDSCGVRPRKADGSYYACSLVDEFSGDQLDRSLWHTMETSPTGQSYCAVDSPETVAVSSGILKLTVRPTDESTPCPAQADGTVAPYATGWVNTFWKWSQQYGRFEVRMRTTASTAPGLQEAFWLWPDVRYSSDTSWPASGEIDVVETYSAYPNLAIPFLHYTENDNGGPVPGLNTSWSCAADRGVWHTYSLEWTATKLSIFVDGRLCLTNTAGASSFQKAFIMSLAQLTTNSGANKADASTLVPASTEVDWVKVWK